MMKSQGDLKNEMKSHFLHGDTEQKSMQTN